MAGAAKAFLFGPYRLVPDQRALLLDGHRVSIRSRAFDLLLALVERRERVILKQELIELVWSGRVVEEGNLTVHIAGLRKLLGKGVIATLPGRGYRFVAPVEETTAAEGAPPGIGQNAPSATDGPRNTRQSAGNLPSPGAELVGRTSALQSLRDLIPGQRVVTLTGPAGIGKTTLSLEICRSLASEFHDGTWFVDLSSLSDPGPVPSAAAGTLGLKLGGTTITSEMVARGIGEQNLLLVLDNCEHVIEAAADLAEAVARRCPRTTVLATSREMLRVAGEAVYRVAPLELPASDDEKLEHLLQRSAVELLVMRTKALNASLEPDESSRSAVAAICRRLDGIPLAIEFAAASVASLGFTQVAAHLDDRFRFLTRGRRTALPRQQTLRAALDWGYELLPEAERRLLRHLGVFAGGFTVDAAAAVPGDDPEAGAIAGDLAALTAKSFVVFDGSVPGGRWRLLETIRAYALEKLRESGELEQAARRHAQHFRDRFMAPALAPQSPLTAELISAHAREIDNVRAALDWAFGDGADITLGVLLTAAYGPIWLHMSLIAECRERAEQAFDCLGGRPELADRLRMQLYFTLGMTLLHTSGPPEKTMGALSAALDVAEALGDVESQLRALWATWTYRINSGEARAAQELGEKFLRLAARVGNPADLLVGDRLVGNAMHYAGDQAAARRHFERVLSLYIEPDHQRHSMWFLHDQRLLARARLARILWLQGLVDQAKSMALDCLDEAQSLDHKLSLCLIHAEVLFPIALMTGDLATAEQSAVQLIDIATRHSMALWIRFGRCLEGSLLIKQGDVARGTAQLRTALDAFRDAGQTVHYVGFLNIIAEGFARTGESARSFEAIDEALALSADSGGNRWCIAEALRIKGELLREGPADRSLQAAEGCLEKALDVARGQSALFWELRAAMSLARLRLQQDRQQEASQGLAAVFARFTEGFDTVDLQSARALLEELRRPRAPT